MFLIGKMPTDTATWPYQQGARTGHRALPHGRDDTRRSTTTLAHTIVCSCPPICNLLNRRRVGTQSSKHKQRTLTSGSRFGVFLYFVMRSCSGLRVAGVFYTAQAQDVQTWYHNRPQLSFHMSRYRMEGSYRISSSKSRNHPHLLNCSPPGGAQAVMVSLNMHPVERNPPSFQRQCSLEPAPV